MYCTDLRAILSISPQMTYFGNLMITGVGFLGAGIIWKGFIETPAGEKIHHVNGLTTAASIWLSAAVGAAAGGKLFFASGFSVASVVLILRFGPRGVEYVDPSTGVSESVARFLDGF